MRLDEYIKIKFSLKSKTNASDKIKSGCVFVDGKKITKCGHKVSENNNVEILQETEFASKGGLKLEAGISHFGFDASGKVFVDVGASNGGFTDCLLWHGAKKVYAVDVGENQLEEHIAKNERVVVMDKTNARYLEKDNFCEEEIYIVSDVSFISNTLLIPVFAGIATEMLLLIKPQFECGKKALNKNGVVTSQADVDEAILRVEQCGEACGLKKVGVCDVSHSLQKNKEYMIYFTK